jgi:hypothetical protein
MTRAKTVMDATIQQQIICSVLSMTVASISKLVFQQYYALLIAFLYFKPGEHDLSIKCTRRTIVPGTDIRDSTIHSHFACWKNWGEICYVSMR